MFVIALTAIILPIFLGFSIYITIFQRVDIIECLTFSVGMGYGILYIVLFVENRFLNIQYSLNNSIGIQVVFLTIVGFLCFERRDMVLSSYNEIIRTFNILNDVLKIKKYRYFLAFLSFLYFLIIYKSLFFPVVEPTASYAYGMLTREIFENKVLPSASQIKNENHYYSYTNLPYVIGGYFCVSNNNFNDIYIKFLPPLYSALSILIIYRISNVFSNNRNVLIFSILFSLGNPYFIKMSIGFMADIFVVFYFLLGTQFLLKFLADKSTKNITLSSIFCAFAALSKLNGYLLFMALFLSLLIWVSLDYLKTSTALKNKPRTLISSIHPIFFYFLIPFILINLPILFWNFMHLGDPVYPHLFGEYHGVQGTVTNIAQTQNQNGNGSFFNSKIITNSKNFAEITIYFIGVLLIYLIILEIKKDFIKIFKMNSVQSFIVWLSIISISIIFIFSFFRYNRGSFIRYSMSSLCLMSIIAAKKLNDIIEGCKLSKFEFRIGIFLVCIAFFYFLSKIFIGESTGILVAHGVLIDFHNRKLLPVISVIGLILLLKYSRHISERTYKKHGNYVIIIISILLIIPPFYSAFAQKDWIFEIDNDFPYIQHPSDTNVLKAEYGSDFVNMVNWINSNTPKNATMLSHTNFRYYIDRTILSLKSPQFKEIPLAENFSEVLQILKKNNVNYYLDVPKSSLIWATCIDMCPIKNNLTDPHMVLKEKYGDFKLFKFNYDLQ